MPKKPKTKMRVELLKKLLDATPGGLEAVALLLKTSKSTVSRISTGHIGGIAQVPALAAALGLPADMCVEIVEAKTRGRHPPKGQRYAANPSKPPPSDTHQALLVLKAKGEVPVELRQPPVDLSTVDTTNLPPTFATGNARLDAMIEVCLQIAERYTLEAHRAPGPRESTMCINVNSLAIGQCRVLREMGGSEAGADRVITIDGYTGPIDAECEEIE
jgi:hypothetical protein